MDSRCMIEGLFPRIEELSNLTMVALKKKHPRGYDSDAYNAKLFRGYTRGRLIREILLKEFRPCASYHDCVSK
jgi:hypothetical protein